MLPSVHGRETINSLSPAGAGTSESADDLRRCRELIERSFAHCYETGGVPGCHLRGRENILKRQLVRVGAYNSGLILRQLLGAGMPRELKNRAGDKCFRDFCAFCCAGWRAVPSSGDSLARLARGWHHLMGTRKWYYPL
jgi:hypothetical protein